MITGLSIDQVSVDMLRPGHVICLNVIEVIGWSSNIMRVITELRFRTGETKRVELELPGDYVLDVMRRELL